MIPCARKVEAEDISAMPLRCQLGWYALREDADGFFKVLPSALGAKEISNEDLNAFPIFEQMRGHERFAKLAKRSVGLQEKSVSSAKKGEI